ncbi:MAG: hypothetical protein U9Q03_04385 [Patescibacteria group bacterium]|nr:hypothetical protein [Patescibacteria group bacterium]
MKRHSLSQREKRQIYRILSRIYVLFNEGRWRIRYDVIRGNYGLCEKEGVSPTSTGFVDEDQRVIWVDYRENILETIIHECLHVIYPDRSEKEILELERFVLHNISRIQAVRLMRHTGHFLI